MINVADLAGKAFEDLAAKVRKEGEALQDAGAPESQVAAMFTQAAELASKGANAKTDDPFYTPEISERKSEEATERQPAERDDEVYPRAVGGGSAAASGSGEPFTVTVCVDGLPRYLDVYTSGKSYDISSGPNYSTS